MSESKSTLDDLRAKTAAILAGKTRPVVPVEPALPHWRPGIHLPPNTRYIGPDGQVMITPRVDADGNVIPESD